MVRAAVSFAVGNGVASVDADGVPVAGVPTVDVRPGSFGAVSGTDRTQPKLIVINIDVINIVMRYLSGVLIRLPESGYLG